MIHILPSYGLTNDKLCIEFMKSADKLRELVEPIYPDHRMRPQKLRQNSSNYWQVLTSFDRFNYSR